MKKKSAGIALILLVGVAAWFAFSSRDRHPDPSSSIQPWNVPGHLISAENKTVDFSAFRGKVVFVNNWASWCPPCIAEMPGIAKLKATLKGEDVVFVMVSFDENPAKGLRFMKRKGYDFQIYFPGQNYPYATTSIPSTFILDKAGEVVSQHTGMADYSGDEVANTLRQLAR